MKILIYRIGNLGDTVCAMPAMVAIRRHFSDAWIGLLTNKETMGNPDAEEILKNNDFIDEIITYDPSRMRRFLYLYKLLKRIRSLEINLLVYLAISKSTRRRLIRDWFFFFFAGCERLLGFKMPRPTKISIKNCVKIPVFPQEVDRLMSLVAPLGIDTTQIGFHLPIKDRDKENVAAIWSHYRLCDKYPIIAICPGGKFAVNHWRSDNFARVAFLLKKEFDAQIIIIGGPGEKLLGERIITKAGISIVNLIGKTTYTESAEVISRCSLLVSNDCGPAHLASAVGTPVVGIYSSRNFPGAWHPWGKNHTVLRNDSLPCRFCFKTECETMECINSIKVDQVFEACKGYLYKE